MRQEPRDRRALPDRQVPLVVPARRELLALPEQPARLVPLEQLELIPLSLVQRVQLVPQGQREQIPQ